MKKVLLAVLIVIVSATTSFASDSFNDVESTAWYYSNVTQITDKGLIEGYPDGSFRPYNTLTYGEFIKMMIIAVSGEDVGNYKNGYWAISYYKKGLELGLYGKNPFDFYGFDEDDVSLEYMLSRNIYRCHVANIISNYLGDIEVKNYDKLLYNFFDVSDSKYAKDIVKSYAAGIMTGYDDWTFKPYQTLTRKEAATILLRVIDPSKRVDIYKDNGTYDYIEYYYDGKASPYIYRATDITLPYNGVVKMVNNCAFFSKYKDKATYLAVYCTKDVQSMTVFVDGRTLLDTVQSDKDYYEVDGYRVFLFNGSDLENHINLKGKKFAIQFTTPSMPWAKERKKVYVIQNVTF